VWPPEALQFLRELEANNDRDWFKANRARYDRDLLAPAHQLADRLSHLGEPRFFRPYRDTRFRPGPPIKEQIALGIGHRDAGGFYVELSLDGLLVGAGLHHPAPDQLGRFRAAIDDDRRAPGFGRALASTRAAGLATNDAGLKRAPKGYSPDHPRIDLLRLTHLTVFARHDLEPWLHTPAADARIQAELESAQPLIAWLAENVGPSAHARPR